MSVGGLPRAMGLRDVVLFNIAAIVGLRWITTAGKIGPFALVLWLVALVAFFIPSALAVADLSESDPGEGGLYRWVTSAFGETHGFLAGWGYWVNNLVYYPSLLVTTAAIGAYALGPENVGLADNQLFVAVFSLVVLWLALGLNILGLDVGKWVQNLGAIGTWIPAVILVVLGAWVLLKFGSATPFEPSQWVPPDFDYSLLAFFATMTFGFAGLELIPVLGGEIRDAARTIRRGILISGALIVFVYLIGTAAILAALPPETVDITNGVPQATAAIELRLGLTGITYIVAVMLVIGNLGGVGAWLAGTARIPFVAGLDRKLPPAFGRVHPKWKSPYVALLVQGGVATLFVLSGLVGEHRRECLSGAAGHDNYPLLYPLPLCVCCVFGAAGKQKWLAGSAQSYGLDGVLVRPAVYIPRFCADRKYGRAVGVRTETMGRCTWFHGCWVLVCPQIG